mgnify:CR=1 FL=1
MKTIWCFTKANFHQTQKMKRTLVCITVYAKFAGPLAMTGKKLVGLVKNI